MLRMYIVIHRNTMNNNTKNLNSFANRKIEVEVFKNSCNQKRQERRNQGTTTTKKRCNGRCKPNQ